MVNGSIIERTEKMAAEYYSVQLGKKSQLWFGLLAG